MLIICQTGAFLPSQPAQTADTSPSAPDVSLFFLSVDNTGRDYQDGEGRCHLTGPLIN